MHDSLFRALADPTRRKVLELLAERDRTAGQLAERFSIAFASVSHHLAILKAAGLVTAEREGQFIRYRLNRPAFQDVVRYLASTFGSGSLYSAARSSAPFKYPVSGTLSSSG